MLLSKLKLKPQIFEGRTDLRGRQSAGGRSINLTLAHRAFATFDALGITDEVRSICVKCRGRYFHGTDGSVRYHPYGPRDEDALYAVSRMGLLRKLLEIADRDPGLQFAFTHRAVSIDLSGSPRLSIDRPEGGDPYQLQVDRIIGADGQSSVARSVLLQDPSYDLHVRYAPVLYREVSLPLAKRGETPLPADGLHIWPRGEVILVAIPNLDGGHTGSLFLPIEGPHGFNAARDRAGLRRLFRELFPDIENRVPSLEFDFFHRPASVLCSVVINRVHRGGEVVLVGDAARSVVPYLGQGLNAGLEDALQLFRALERNDLAFGKAFAEYNEARVPDNYALQELAFAHYEELAVKGAQQDYIVRKQLERTVQELMPKEFESLYSMVSFSARPYAECARLAAKQERVLTRLLSRPGIVERMGTPGFKQEALEVLQTVQ